MSILNAPLTRSSLATLILGASVAWNYSEAAPVKGDGRKVSPILEVLPVGSNLRNFFVPRYGKDLQPTSLLTAELMQVISKEKITAEKITYSLFSAEGGEKAKVKIKHATFDVPRGVLIAQEKITLTSQDPCIEATGTGGFLLLDSEASFITGPIEATIFPSAEKKLSSRNLLQPQISATSKPTTMNSLQSIFLLGFTPWIATASLEPTPSELQTIAESAQENIPNSATLVSKREGTDLQQAQLSSAAGLHKHAKNYQHEQQLFNAKERQLQMDTTRFAQQIGRPKLFLISTEEEKKAPPKAVSSTEKEIDVSAILPARNAPRAPDSVRITSEGGLFTDTEKGQAVFLKNVKFIDDQATLTCKKDLKIFYTAEKKEETAKKKKSGGAPGIGQLKVDEIEQIIGTGGVTIILHGKDGAEPTIATAETILYNMASQTIILKGGFPTIYQKGVMGIQALEPDLTIKIGKDFYAKPGKWNTDYTPPEEKKSAKKKK